MKLVEILTKITPPPWKISGESIVTDDVCIAVIEDDGGYEAITEQRAANAVYIPHAANVLPALVDELNRLLDCVGETDVELIQAVLKTAEEVKVAGFAASSVSACHLCDEGDTQHLHCQICAVLPYTGTALVGGVETRVCNDPACVAQCD